MLYRSERHTEAIDAYRSVLAKVLGEPFGEVHSIGHTQFVQFYAGTFELGNGLYEVARVGPQASMVVGDYHGTVRAGKP